MKYNHQEGLVHQYQIVHPVVFLQSPTVQLISDIHRQRWWVWGMWGLVWNVEGLGQNVTYSTERHCELSKGQFWVDLKV